MPVSDVVEKSALVTGRGHRVRQVLEQSLVTFLKEDALTVSGSIAYFALLSLFPLMLLLLSVGGVYIRRYELGGTLTEVLEGFLPMKPDFIMRELVRISQSFGRITLVSFLLLLWSSLGMFGPLENALNRAWQVERRRPLWRSYFLAFEMAFLFLVFILIYSGLVGLNFYVQDVLSGWTELPWTAALAKVASELLFLAARFGMTLGMFTALFQRLPNRQLGSRRVLPGALVTALLWEAVRVLFTHLLPHFNYSHVYGSIGVVVALMTWLYVSSAVTLFGAHVSRNLYRTLHPPAAKPQAAIPDSTDIQSG